MKPAETEITSDIPSGPVALYRFYADDGSLLYVGVTDDLRQRLASHAREKPWWPMVTRKTVAWYDNRMDAEIGEANAIADEYPAHNVLSHAALTGRPRAPREALKVDVPVELHLTRRLRSYRIDNGVDIRDQVATAVDEWLTREGY